MSDAIKWGLLAAAIIILIALVVSLPFFQFMNVDVFGDAISTIIFYVGSAFQFARGAINIFFSPWGRTAITGLLIYWFGKWALTVVIKLSAWVYHFVFK